MRIYCNGDSFVSGAELADFILPEYPGSWSKFDHKKRKLCKKWIDKTYDQEDILGKKRTELIEKIFHLEYQKSWPKKIHNKTNIEVINNARGGSSLDRIIRTSLSDLIQLKSSSDRIVAIIGTTALDRQEIPTNGNINEYDWVGQNKHWEQVASTFKNPHLANLIDDFIDYKIEFETNYHQLVKAFTNIITLKDFCKYNNIELYWICGLHNLLNISPENTILDQRDLKLRQEYVDFKYWFNMNEIADNMSPTDEIFCPNGHYSEIVHEKLSDLIINELGL